MRFEWVGGIVRCKLFRLKAELRILRKMYEEHMRVSQETLEMTYKKKVKTNSNQ